MAARRKFWVLLALCTTATVFQLFPANCASFIAEGALNAFDFCAVVNCASSTFFDFCNPAPLLLDCFN
jgi:hypothetical protein